MNAFEDGEMNFFFCEINPDTGRYELVELPATYSGSPYKEWRLPNDRPDWVNFGRREVLRGSLNKEKAIADVRLALSKDRARAVASLELIDQHLAEVDALR